MTEILFFTLNYPSTTSTTLYLFTSYLYAQVASKMLRSVFYEPVSWIFLFSSDIKSLNPSIICLVAIHILQALKVHS